MGHELEHVRQYRAGLGGADKKRLREFLAFHREALAPVVAGTGRINDSTRVSLIDEALRNYFCLTAQLQTEHNRKKDELLEARARYAARGYVLPAVPTTCPTSP